MLRDWDVKRSIQIWWETRQMQCQELDSFLHTLILSARSWGFSAFDAISIMSSYYMTAYIIHSISTQYHNSTKYSTTAVLYIRGIHSTAILINFLKRTSPRCSRRLNRSSQHLHLQMQCNQSIHSDRKEHGSVARFRSEESVPQLSAHIHRPSTFLLMSDHVYQARLSPRTL